MDIIEYSNILDELSVVGSKISPFDCLEHLYLDESIFPQYFQLPDVVDLNIKIKRVIVKSTNIIGAIGQPVIGIVFFEGIEILARKPINSIE